MIHTMDDMYVNKFLTSLLARSVDASVILKLDRVSIAIPLVVQNEN